MKCVIAFLFLFFTCGIQQKSNPQFFNTQQNQLHGNENDHPMLIGDMVQFLFTGNFEHTHFHHDQNEDESHQHPHQHSSFISAVFADDIPATFQFHFVNFKLKWPIGLNLNLSKTFQSELLRPPIFNG